jgi:hypothetical protein
MKHVHAAITFALIASLGTSQAQAATAKFHVPNPPFVNKTIAFAKKHPKLTCAICAYAIYKASSALYHACADTPDEKLFKFNPGYRNQDLPTHVPNTPSIKQQVVIYAHGFGKSDESTKECYAMIENKDKNFSDKNFLVLFNFGEAHLLDKPKRLSVQGIVNKIKAVLRINLGGIVDTQVLLKTVKDYSAKQVDIVLICPSRSAAACIRMLHMLSFPTMKKYKKKYKKTWKKFGLLLKNGEPDIERINSIKKSIKKIFIINPLLDTNSTLYNLITRNVTQRKFIANSLRRGTQILLTACTRYSPFEAQPIDLLKELTTQDFDIEFTLVEENKDEIVGNAHDKDIENYVKIAQKNGKPWLLHPGHNKNHGDKDVSINAIVAYLQKKK